MISSPCIKICVVEGSLCSGCGRTLAEIAEWRSLTEERRQTIMRELPARLAKFAAAKNAAVPVR